MALHPVGAESVAVIVAVLLFWSAFIMMLGAGFDPEILTAVELLVVHVTSPFAFWAFNVVELLNCNDMGLAGYIDRLHTAAALTVMELVLEQPPASVAVMMTLPAFTAVTTPEEFTVATLGSLELQLTAPAGLVAVSVFVPPIVIVAELGVRPSAQLVVIEEESEQPAASVAVTVAEPLPTPRATPEELTETMLELLEVQDTAPYGLLAVRLVVAPTFIVSDDGATLNVQATVIAEVSTHPAASVAVIVALPTLLPVTTPQALTVATLGSLEFQTTAPQAS